jgi:hypothetical protein
LTLQQKEGINQCTQKEIVLGQVCQTKNYLPCFGAPLLKEVAMPKLDTGRQKTLPDLRLVTHGGDKSYE